MISFDVSMERKQPTAGQEVNYLSAVLSDNVSCLLRSEF